MTKQEIVAKVKSLKLAKGSYVVFGSCPLAVADIREAHDVDLFVTPGALLAIKQLCSEGSVVRSDAECFANADFDAHTNWDIGTYKPSLHQLLATATVFDGVPFASLGHVRAWKLASGRPKDLRDVRLIDEYYSKST